MGPTTPSPAPTGRAAASVPVEPAAHDVIIVPLDGSELSEHAVQPALWLAGLLGAEAHAVAVTYRDEIAWYEPYARHLGTRWPQFVPHHLSRPTAAAGIVAMAERLPGALVCMATHGRARSAAVLGSTFTSVARAHPLPVMAVGPEASVPSKGLDRVVACIDGTATSERALLLAASWALRLRARLDLVGVAEPRGPLPDRNEHHPAWLDDPSAYLAELTARPELDYLETGTHVLVDPLGPAQAINDHLYWDPAALVVTASHLRTYLDRAVHGSTTARIIRTCPVPVLVQPAVDPHLGG